MITTQEKTVNISLFTIFRCAAIKVCLHDILFHPTAVQGSSRSHDDRRKLNRRNYQHNLQHRQSSGAFGGINSLQRHSLTRLTMALVQVSE